jgi:hypothetical protein
MLNQISSAMTKKIFIVLLVAFCFGCTKKQRDVLDCPPQACTMVFVSVNVKFQDKNGNALAVKDFSAVNQRTKEIISTGNQQSNNGVGYYTVADDNTRSKLSTQGDEIVVSATHPTTGQTKTATFKISGGCNCHVERISGPQVIAFD